MNDPMELPSTDDQGFSPVQSDPPGFATPTLVGLGAALASAAAWAAITVATKYQVGFMAVGVGLLVGWVVRKFGAATSAHAVLASGLALFGCVLGNLFSTCGFIAAQQSVPFFTVAAAVLTSPSAAIEVLGATFNPMDLLFYAIAVYEAHKLVKMPSRKA